MTVRHIEKSRTRDYIGLSSDTKPTSNETIGSTFTEEDTGRKYMYGELGWFLPGATTQYPLPTDGDSVYVKDVKDSLSEVGTFTDANLLTLFDNLDGSIVDSSATNPKWFMFKLERPITSGGVGIVAHEGDFSNVHVEFMDRQENLLAEKDESSDNTKHDAYRYPLTARDVCCIKVSFHTADPVTVSFLRIAKDVSVTARVKGINPDGAETEVRTTKEGALSVSDFLFEVARGNISGMKMYSIPGRKNSISSTVLDDLTQIPGTTVVPVPGGIQLEAVSDNVNDTSAGTGARTLEVHYLDTSGEEQSETIVLDGTTPVDTVAEDIDYVQWMHTKTVGDNTVAAGNISLRDTSGVTTYEYIEAGGNQSLSARFMVPSGKTGYITGWQSSSVVKRVDIRLRATVERFDRTIVPGVFLFQDNVVLNDAVSGWLPFDVWLKVPAGGEVKISGISAAAGGDAGGKFNILLIDD